MVVVLSPDVLDQILRARGCVDRDLWAAGTVYRPDLPGLEIEIETLLSFAG